MTCFLLRTAVPLAVRSADGKLVEAISGTVRARWARVNGEMEADAEVMEAE